MYKVCFKCNSEKSLEDFPKHKYMKDGHLNKCKECDRNDARLNRLKNLDKARAHDKERSLLPDRISLRDKVFAKWKLNNPNKRSAQIKVSNAIRTGKLVPWPTCALPECSLKPEAHHPDYSEPLSVVWLCRAHHMQAHAIK